MAFSVLLTDDAARDLDVLLIVDDRRNMQERLQRRLLQV